MVGDRRSGANPAEIAEVCAFQSWYFKTHSAEHSGRRQQGVREETPQQTAKAAGSVQGKAQTLG